MSRPPQDTPIATADLFDEIPDKLAVCRVPFRSFGGRRRFHGPVITARVFQDNTGVKEALRRAQPGQVLVVDGGASLHCALLGDRLAAIGVERGLRGIVIHGAVRDVAALGELDLGVLALASNPRRSGDGVPGEQDVDLAIGGLVIRAGGYLYVDEDAVVYAAEPVHG